MTNLDSILKSKDITLPTKVCIQSYSHVWMWGLNHKEGWTLKNWCFWTILSVPWTARRSNQSILKEINPEYSLGGMKLKLQYSGHLMWRAKSLEKTLMLGKIGREWGNRGCDGWMASPTPWTWVWAGFRRWWRAGKPGVLQSMGLQRVGHDWATKQQHYCC